MTEAITNNVLDAIKAVPLLSPSVSQLLTLSSNPNFALSDMANVIKTDAILTARVLKIVNSAAFCLPVEINSVERATSMLGARVIVGIALGSAGDGIMTAPLDGYDNVHDGVWKHNLFCAIAAHRIGLRAKGDFKPDQAFTGGLLHDIGKTVISEFLKGTSNEMIAEIEHGDKDDYLACEKTRLGLDHAEVGYEVAKHWELTLPLQNAIRYHHVPHLADKQYQAVCYAVHLGDILAMMAGFDTGSDALQYQLDPQYTEYFEIKEDQLSIILLESTEEFHELEASLEQSL